MKTERKLINIPNAMTLFRLPAAPIMLWLVLSLDNVPDRKWASLSIIILALFVFLSDYLDGIVARAMNAVTDFGKIMDPIADSTFFMTLLIGFSFSERFHIPLWIPLAVIYREVAMHVIRRYAALRGTVLAAKSFGKLKMAVQSVVMALIALFTFAIDWGFLKEERSVIGKTADAFNEAIGVISQNEQLLINFAYWGGTLIAVVNVLSLIPYLKGSTELIREYHFDEEK